MIEYGNELLAARVRRRITQGELGERAGLAVPTIVDIERNRLGIDDATYRRLLEALDQIAQEQADVQAAA